MKLHLSAVLLGIVSAASAEDTISVQLVQYRVGASLGSEVPFNVKPMGHDYGAELSFLVKGKGLVSFKEDSVAISRFTSRDGKELSKSPNGKANWGESPFPKVAENGSLASFAVEFKDDLIGKIEGGTIEGSFSMFTGGETDKDSANVTKGAKAVEIGPFKVSIGKSGMFGGDGTSIKIQGDYASIIEITAKDGDKKLNSSGSSWSGDTKTYSFDQAKAEQIEVTISYWKNLSEVVVPFKATVGG